MDVDGFSFPMGIQHPVHQNFCDLREIKQMLLSGDKEQMCMAANKVLCQMESDEQVTQMISSDIAEFLCDAMLPFDLYMSGTVHKCLAIMTHYETFFIHNHSSFAMETVIRSMNFTIKSKTHDCAGIQSLKILLLIVQGYVTYDVLPEKKPFQNLLNLLLVLLNKEAVTSETHNQIGHIMKALLDLDLWKLHSLGSPIEICDKWFDFIFHSRNENSRASAEELTHLGCSLSEQTLRYLIGKNKSEHSMETLAESESEAVSCFVTKISNFLLEFAAANIAGEPLTYEKSEAEKLSNYFTSLSHLHRDLLPQGIPRSARKLSEMGFIQIITMILSNVNFESYDNLREISASVLFETILALADEIFRFPEMWPSGRDHFRREILRGAALIPKNASSWSDAVTDPECSKSSRLALIVYFYFHSFTMKSPCDPGRMHPSAGKLINSLIGINSSPLLIKAAWFVYVMSRMGKTADPQEGVNDAAGKMLEILDNQKEFSLIYTHHPALLYWAFSSSKISYHVQCEVVKNWLENRSPDCCVLDDLLKTSADVRFAVFGLLQSGNAHVAHSAFSTLKTFALESEDENLSHNIWFVLPQTLAKYTTQTSNAVKVDYILELASLRIPERPDMSKIIRVASLLPEAVEKSDLISLASALKLTLQLLEISIRQDDLRVLFAVLRYENFTQRILSGIDADVTDVVSTSLKIITILWSEQVSAAVATHCHKQITLNAYNMLNVLNGADAELTRTALILMEEMLKTKFESGLFSVAGVSSDFMAVLLYDLENISIKHSPTVSGVVWSCLKHCFLSAGGDVLSEDALIHEAIAFNLCHLGDTPEMSDFLVTWIDGRLEREGPRNGFRHVGDGYFAETIGRVASHLSENPFRGVENLSRKILDCCRQLSLDTSRPPFREIEMYFSHSRLS